VYGQLIVVIKQRLGALLMTKQPRRNDYTDEVVAFLICFSALC